MVARLETTPMPMNLNFSRSLLFACAVASCGGVLLTACQSRQAPALSHGATASTAIQSTTDCILEARGRINMALAALRNLTDRPTDIPAQYRVVEQQLAALAASSAKITASAEVMRAKSDAYLADWAKQVAAIRDVDLRRAAFDRRAEVSARSQAVFQGYQKAMIDLAAFEATLADIRRSLGSDLGSRGLETVKPFVTKADATAEPLKVSLDKVARDFRALAFSLQPVSAAN